MLFDSRLARNRTASSVGRENGVLPSRLSVCNEPAVQTVCALGDIQDLGEWHLTVVLESSASRSENHVSGRQLDSLAAHLKRQQALNHLEGAVASQSLAPAASTRRGPRGVSRHAHGGLVAQPLGHDDGRGGEVAVALRGRHERLDDLVEARLAAEVLDAVVLGYKVRRGRVGSQLVHGGADVPSGGVARGRVGAVHDVPGWDVVELRVNIEDLQS